MCSWGVFVLATPLLIVVEVHLALWKRLPICFIVYALAMLCMATCAVGSAGNALAQSTSAPAEVYRVRLCPA